MNFYWLFFITWCLSMIKRAFIETQYQWKVQSPIKIEKYRWWMGNICVNDHFILCLQEIFIILKYKSTNFKCVKRIHNFQIWLDMTTWFFDKIGFYKIYKSKTCQFLKIMKITIYYLWLTSITFIRWSPIVCSFHRCVHDVLNNSSCL